MKRCFCALKRRRKNKLLIIGGISLGKVKTDQIKKTGKELMSRFPTTFTSNFDENKKLVDTLTQGTTIRVRNKIAGYITRTITLSQAGSESETEDDIEEE